MIFKYYNIIFLVLFVVKNCIICQVDRVFTAILLLLCKKKKKSFTALIMINISLLVISCNNY